MQSYALPQDFILPALETTRLVLEPILESHAQELNDLFNDMELHYFVPYKALSLEEMSKRCARWAGRRSSSGDELWLNWAARHKDSKQVIAHFQSGVKTDGVATIGYIVARRFQNQGIAMEGMLSVFEYLQQTLLVCEVKAWSDMRNKASHRLAEKLGMTQVDFIKDADFFNGTTSDEFVFSKVFRR